MRIGILTHYNVYNLGAQLQMLSMQSWLQDHGHSVKILTYEKNFDFDKGEKSKNSGSFKAIGYYIKNYVLKKGIGLTLFNYRKVKTMNKVLTTLDLVPYQSEDIDAVIIGSDEVFSIDVGCNPMMYGHGINKPIITYAPAFGRTTIDLLKEYHCYDLVKEGLSKINYLSARDVHTKEMMEEMTGREVDIVCDPVLLYRGNRLDKEVKIINKPFLLIYSYDRHMVDKDEIEQIQSFAKKEGLITVSLGTYHKWCDKNIVCDSMEWQSYFKQAKYVLTDTFHGTIVGLKNHCNVAVFFRDWINSYKLESLLKETGTLNRKIPKIDESYLKTVFSKEINYQEVDRHIEKMRSHSEAYLNHALENIHE